MATEMKISDDIRWGKIVKSWATGKNYVNPNDPPLTLPRTQPELVAMCLELGVTITFPDEQDGLAIIQYSPQTVVLKLPPKTMVEATERKFDGANAEYPMPPFYSKFFRADFPTDLSKEDLLDLHAARIGDYAVRNCG
ncbi:hypothetical protein GJW-30_1_04024 [Variibacter gotjawalensis]|uniref:Uncharacterized protein n=1 Tax=Variibacter gotjawalensis TaxID=1333996 RepID=A0A0S3PZX2_9BRAD|nr:hypothetical protein [Variibacter gotjawalensis]NIK47307.1 hypothetical protein [Variibacter gotjawalensis]RZS49205.1 hypothetical protein EV661_1631 [Variibacter gotjawalensis]BAT61467.1 hypothetical protein GJW-30_1_04024 [Variibacter gotjawalensis]